MRSSAASREKILEFIRHEIAEKGYPPSIREICAGTGLRSTSTVHAHLNRMEQMGMIRRDPEKPRAMEVTAEGLCRDRAVPLAGSTPGGLPDLSLRNTDGTLVLPEDIAGGSSVFCIRVRNGSGDGVGIRDGDIVVIRRQSSVEDGQIEVIASDASVVLKRAGKADQARPAEGPETIGRAIALIRRL